MQISRVIAEVDNDHEYIYEVTDMALFPIIADCLSGSSLQTYTSDFARHFLQFLEPFSTATTETTLPLFDLMSEGMYQAASLAIFGPLFPVNSHRDFALLDTNLHLLLLHMPFVGRPAIHARQRLLARVSEYIKNGWRSEGEGYIEGASELASGCIRVLKNSNISDANIASTFLTFMWGIHAMSMRSSFWVMAHLLTHENAMNRVREEADKAIAMTPGSLHSFLSLPDALDATRLPLLDSSVKETARHITVMGGLREAVADMEIRGTDQTYVVQKGEYVLTYLRAQNHDESDFPDPDLYKFDRFAGAESEKRLNNLARMNWGGGKHLVWSTSFALYVFQLTASGQCKGRHFAQFTLKCATMMCLHLLDITPVTTSDGESITPKVSPRSVGVLRADEEWLVRVRWRRP
jgi:cytochrome P450